MSPAAQTAGSGADPGRLAGTVRPVLVDPSSATGLIIRTTAR